MANHNNITTLYGNLDVNNFLSYLPIEIRIWMDHMKFLQDCLSICARFMA